VLGVQGRAADISDIKSALQRNSAKRRPHVLLQIAVNNIRRKIEGVQRKERERERENHSGPFSTIESLTIFANPDICTICLRVLSRDTEIYRYRGCFGAVLSILSLVCFCYYPQFSIGLSTMGIPENSPWQSKSVIQFFSCAPAVNLSRTRLQTAQLTSRRGRQLAHIKL